MKDSSLVPIAKEVIQCLKNGNTVIFEVTKIRTVKEEMDYCIRIPVTDNEGFLNNLNNDYKKNYSEDEILIEFSQWIMNSLQKNFKEEIITIKLTYLFADKALSTEELQQFDSLMSEIESKQIRTNTWLTLLFEDEILKF